MKKRISCLVIGALVLSFSPTISLADRYGYEGGPRGHHQGPGPSYYGRGGHDHQRSCDPRAHYRRNNYYQNNYYYNDRHNNDWIAPVAILGTALGFMALSQPYNPPPPPPRRMCQDAYNHVDQYGRYLYTEYVSRPCY